jgi:branched-chain amino acid transport system substrate-binding protein
MNMYIAQAKNGKFQIVKNLGVVDPKERVLSAADMRGETRH